MEVKCGDRIKQLRNKKNITQDEMAQLLDVDRSTFASWEINRREPDLSALCNIADRFEVTLDWLVGRGAVPKDAQAVTGEDAEWLEVMGSAQKRGFSAVNVKSLLDLITKIAPKNR
ncbi:MAG: helix-turn-helix transcriptional regulator [Negativicutes bacterium]|nr:helix-turn-helix transcriptional regulator [Negativicutes bacterium]